MRSSPGSFRLLRAWAPAALLAVAVVTAGGCTAGTAAPRTARPVPGAAAAWPAYLDGPRHQSYARAATTITAANAGRLVLKWSHSAGSPYLASPAVSDGSVFIGAGNGWFFKLSVSTGKVEASRYLGRFPPNRCSSAGIADTAAVASDPVTGALTVYIGGAGGYLYALSAANLAVRWKSPVETSVPDYYQWSSPTVANGTVYIGAASDCEQPLVRGAVIAFSQATGKKLAGFRTVPAGQVGGGVWSTVAVGPGGYVYATTGNGPPDDLRNGYSESIVKLAPRTLKVAGSWQVPGPPVSYDTDFGGSPVIFGQDVGACNKDGIFYAVSQSSMKLAWQERIGATYRPGVAAECDGSPAFDGTYLYFGGTGVTIGARAYRGSVQKRAGATGKLVWETGLLNGVTGSPTLDGAGVLAVGTYDNGPSGLEGTYLVSAASGKILTRLAAGRDFAESTFADGRLFTANVAGVSGWAPG
jgi:outer membrane protein assembly factor BamB